ncbi:protein suppressor 2 of zeste-like [Ylistrum balloti]|uniref:protein suppressor 2 of zeste-like n=1 Tax=Ylistrum balloti TaxID=509963 RepID=UPI002905BA45|nr:protein suppressor 2 of zeste-like [Ylistrum balloti]
MLPTAKMKLSELNPHLICVLCGGYLIDATTIMRCLHSFCKTCIVHYLQTSHYCPVCTGLVHKKNPFSELRSDHLLQNIVYKAVPGLFTDEMSRRRACYKNQDQETDAEAIGKRSVEIGKRIIISPEENISLSLEFTTNLSACDDIETENQTIDIRYLLCPAAVTIGNLKKFLRMKFSLLDTYLVDLYHEDEVLLDNYSLVDVAYISSWNGQDVLKLSYSIYENPAKRLKRAKSIDNVRCNNDDSGIEDGNQSFESSPSTDTSMLNDSGQGLECDMNKTEVLKPLEIATDSSMEETSAKIEPDISVSEQTDINTINDTETTCDQNKECIPNENPAPNSICSNDISLPSVSNTNDRTSGSGECPEVVESLFKDEEDVVIDKLDETVNRIIAETDNETDAMDQSTEKKTIDVRRFSNASTETEIHDSSVSVQTDVQCCSDSLGLTLCVEHTHTCTQTHDSISGSNGSCADVGMQTTPVSPAKQCSVQDKGTQHNGCESERTDKVACSAHKSHSKSEEKVSKETDKSCSGVCNGHSVKPRNEKLVVKLSKEKDSESYTATIS